MAVRFTPTYERTRFVMRTIMLVLLLVALGSGMVVRDASAQLAAQLVVPPAGPVSLTLGQESTIAFTLLNTGSVTWQSDVILQSVDSLGVHAVASSLASGWLTSSTVLTIADTVYARASVNRSNAVVLSWTAPGDDGMVGQAARYDLRSAPQSITDTMWPLLTQIVGTPLPALSGTKQSFVVSGLQPSTLYHFRLKTYDEAGNGSLLSNDASTTTASNQEALQFRIRGTIAGAQTLFVRLLQPSSSTFFGPVIRIPVQVTGGSNAVVPWIPLVGDLNHDGLTDIVIADTLGTWTGALNDSVSYTPLAQPMLSNFGVGTGLRRYLADFNGDGYAEACTYDSIPGRWKLSRNLGNGTMQPQDGPWSGNAALTGWAMLPNVYDTGIGDFNGDHAADLYAHEYDNGWWFTALSDRTNSFVPQARAIAGWATPPETYQTSVGDFNGNQRDDICSAQNEGGWLFVMMSSGTSFVANTGTGQYGSWGRIPGPQGWLIKSGRFNADQLGDELVFRPDSGTVDVWLNTGHSFGPAKRWLQLTPGDPVTLFVGDLDHDGLQDLILSYPDGRWMGCKNLNGSFAQPRLMLSGFPTGALVRSTAGVDGTLEYSSARIWPNPAFRSASIAFTLTQPSAARVTVHDIAGRLVATVLDGNLPAGNQVVTWRIPASVPVGLYLVQIRTVEGVRVLKLSHVR